MNTKILVSLLVIGLTAIAIGGTMTGAFFSDSETSTQNTFAAGSIDLKVDSECSWNGLNCTRANDLNTYWGGIPANGRCDCNWTLKDLNTTDRFFNFSDIKPGDFGENTISLHVNSNNAWVCASVSNLTNAENNCTEPESQEDTTCDNPGLGQGELQNNLTLAIWRDTNCNNVLEAGTPAVPAHCGGTATNPEIVCSEITFESDCSGTSGCTWVPLVVSGPGETVLASGPLVNGTWAIYDNTTGTGPLLGNTTGCVGMLWSLPNATGNIVQTDGVIGDISFSVVQSRNNMDFRCVPSNTTVCGNNAVESGEVCDNNSQACTTNGYTGTQACNVQCSGWTECISNQFCGDGITNGNETCDEGSSNGLPDHCNALCTGITPPGICIAKPDVMSVLDRSGSINSTNMAILKSAAHGFVTALDPKTNGTHMGQVSFGNNGTLDLHLTGNKTAIDLAIDGINPGGNTNLYQGLLLANNELAGANDRPDATSPDYLVVITDGEPNDQNSAKIQADAADTVNTTIYVVGVGINATNADWLKSNIATNSSYYFAAADFSQLDSILQGIANCTN